MCTNTTWNLNCDFFSLVRLKFKRGGRGRLPSAVGPKELFQVIEAMYRGKGKAVCV